MIEEKQLTKVDENGVVVIDPEAIEKLVAMKESKSNSAKEFEAEVKEVILNLMTKYGCPMIKSTTYTVSKVQPADKVEFDSEKFLLETQPEILADFVSVIEDKKFNEAKFREENPELYEKYVDIDYVSEVNTKKLAKSMPTLYDKYTTTIKSDKAPTLRIVENKK